ncbi:MAG: hypothetical protein C4339_00495 [Nitrososphaerota archaeon]
MQPLLSLETSLGDVARTKLVTLNHKDTLAEAVRRIVRESFRRVPIVDDEGYLLGLSNAMDLLTVVYRAYRLSAQKGDYSIFRRVIERPLGEFNWLNYICLPAQTPLADAIRAMWRKGVGVVVLLEEGKPTGILTERDIVIRLTKEPALQEYVSRHMTKDFYKASADAPLRDVLEKMVEVGIRRIPIFDGEELAGLLREKDALSSIATHLTKPEELNRLLQEPVIKVSSAKPPSVYPEASLSYAASLMSELGLGILMVYNGQRYLGVLTEKDILTALVKRHPHLRPLRLRS